MFNKHKLEFSSDTNMWGYSQKYYFLLDNVETHVILFSFVVTKANEANWGFMAATNWPDSNLLIIKIPEKRRPQNRPQHKLIFRLLSLKWTSVCNPLSNHFLFRVVVFIVKRQFVTWIDWCCAPLIFLRCYLRDLPRIQTIFVLN